ncbi:porin [Tritonibacter mobilis]|uniref:porin n=1 Tax=Tritonibacter mobilis TaxID=379347 RepID=UPI001CD9295A|nr:porin [Tritonibacter mobilis]MCA2006243.1 porin [Tritonibacter mobilis]
MKKILFASTALIVTAGIASAEVTLGGYGRVGLLYNEGNANETEIEQRMRLNITGIAETDAGVKLEARFRIQSDSASNSSIAGSAAGAAGFAVSYGGLRVDVGNVSNVMDSGDQVDLFGYGVGFTSFLEHNANFGAPTVGFDNENQDFTTVKASYAFGDFSTSVSYYDDKVANDEQFQIGLGYTLANGMSIGAVYSDTDSEGDYWVLGLNGTAGAVGYSVIVGDGDNQNDTSFGASINYEVSSATSIRAMVSSGDVIDTDGVGGTDFDDDVSYGLGFRHGLGGGVTLAGGVGSNNRGNTMADLGVVFNF